MKRILITGPNNPLAKNILNDVIKLFPDSNIITLSRSSKIDSHANIVEHHSCDLSRSVPAFKDIDMLIHTASCVPAIASSRSEFMKVNFEGASKLINNIKFNTNAKILNISTSSVYNDSEKDILYEGSNKTSQDLYGLSKLKFERFLEKVQFIFCKLFKL